MSVQSVQLPYPEVRRRESVLQHRLVRVWWAYAYILDEPSIGLHQRDNDKLLRNSEASAVILGILLIVVEHDEDTMRGGRLILWTSDLEPVNMVEK